MRGFFFGLDLTDYDAERMPETPVVLTSALRRLLPRHMSMFWPVRPVVCAQASLCPLFWVLAYYVVACDTFRDPFV